jgi:energy-coupling factor transporter ATP-binding protein EcfA2
MEYIISKNQKVIEEKFHQITNEELKLKETQKLLKNKLIELTSEHDKKVQKLNDQEEKNKKSLKKVEENKKLLIEDIKAKKDEILSLKNQEEEMGKKLEKLRSFIKEKADTLLNLEFIDQEEYNDLLEIHKEEEIDEKFVDFKQDLEADKQKAISHIQAYLFNKDIIYPRYILEDFFALIQTNDLIVLAGESGSGKTNLVKSFADAIGGKSFIIPVKPNWTSSEDLLGYYNPLEKKYLSTPFLDALLEAKNNPEIPYFICLDEMNLARVEYYFADFLSLLEERDEQPEIKLYSEDESAHILSEFKHVMTTIEFVKDKYKKNNVINFIELLKDEDINRELTRIFGFSDKDSLVKYHTDLEKC